MSTTQDEILDTNPPVYSRSSSPTLASSSISVFEVDDHDAAPDYPDAPRYSAVFALHGRPIQGTRASHPLTTEHEYGLDKSGTPWVKLNFISRATSSTDAPKFEGGDDIAGSLILDLDSPTSITSITISIKGYLITGATDEGTYTFLNKSYNVWTKAMGDPRYVSSTQNIKHRGNLDSGEYTWPFSIPFPTSFDYWDSPTPAEAKPYLSPQSFLERGAPATLQYKFCLNIRRGVLRADKEITVPIIYIPRIVPEKPSDLRQRSYREALPLMGPLEDPDGWKTFSTVKLQPKLSGSQQAGKMECELSIATPSCYARGTVIPCRLVLKSEDSVVLDALSTSDAINLNLQRRIKYHLKGMRGSVTTETSTLQRAVWWTPADTSFPEENNVRSLEGEIHLSRSLYSSSDSPFFSVEYMIQLSALDSDAIHPESGILDPPLTHPITIGTFAARGPRTREYAPRS